jgi:hypothetical protein
MNKGKRQEKAEGKRQKAKEGKGQKIEARRRSHDGRGDCRV